MKYSELIQMSVKAIHAFLAANPGHKAGENALREVEREKNRVAKLARLGVKTAPASGATKVRFAYKGGRRGPTKRELR